MAFSIITNPATYSPVNKEIWVQVDDTLSSQQNFKYIFNVDKIDPITSVATSLGSYQVPPRPSSGYGLFTPHKILRSQISYNLQPYVQWITNAPESIIRYRFRYGIQYTTSVPYTGALNLSGSLGLSLVPSSTNPFLAGDIIYIDKTNKQSNPQYDGTASVTTSFYGLILGVTVSYVITDQTYVTSSTSDAGYITEITRATGTSSDLYAYNGTRQYDEININFGNQLVFRDDGTPTNFLTNYGSYDPYQTLPTVADMEREGKSIFSYQFETLSVLQDTAFANLQYSIGAFSATGSLLTTGYAQATSSTNIAYRRFDIPIGTANLTLKGLFGTTSNIKYYLVIVYDSAYTAKATKFYKVIDNCSKYPNNFRIAFLNRFGGFDYYNFNYKSTNVINKTSTEFKKILDYNYKIGDRQDTILSQDANNSWTISTDWITQKESEYFKQLLTSPEPYLVPDPWEFFDNSYNFGNYLGFVGKKKHKFRVGDQITIKQFPGFTHGSYNGTFNIIRIADEFSIVTDGTFVSTTGAEGGLAYYTDNRFYPIVITDTSYQVKTAIDDTLFSYSITFRYAYQVNLQNQ